MTGVWRVNLLPSGRSVDAREFCLKRNIVGVGWPLKDLPSGATWDEYRSRADIFYRQQENSGGWWPVLRALHDRIEVGHLVWTRDGDGTYWLGRVESPWRYVLDEDHEAADIVNVRDCTWTKVGAADEVPGPVTTSFRGLTLTEVKEPSASLTKLIYNDKAGSSGYEIKLGEADRYHSAPADVVFLFSARGRYVNRPDGGNVECMNPEDIRHFFDENPTLIPERTRRWMEALRGDAP